MTERWITVAFAPDYEVSDEGRVRRRVSARNYRAGRCLKPDVHDDGHMTVTFRVDKVSVTRYLHQVVLFAFVGPKPSKLHQGAHGDGNPSNNHLSNLRWATPLENSEDRKLHGTWPAGEINGNAKLTDLQVRLIRSRVAFGFSKAETARLFRCSDTHVTRIVNGAMRAQAGGYGIDE